MLPATLGEEVRRKITSFAVALSSLAMISVGWVIPADATSDSATWNLKGGNRFQVNAWHCGSYVNTCSWTSSTKLLGSNPYNARWIQNKAELEAHGFRASLKISKNPEATLTMKKKSLGIVRWTNTTAWIADNSGKMDPNWSTAYVSTRSCGSAKVTKKIVVSEKCVYAGAF